MLGLADIEGGPDQEIAILTGAAADDFRAQRVGTQKAVGAMLLGRADRDQDGFGAGEISGQVER